MNKLNLNKFYPVYQSILGIAAVLVFVTHADIYFANIDILFDPLIWIILFIMASLPLYLSFFAKLKYLPIPILIASGIYLIIACYSFTLSDFTDTVFSEFRARVLTVIFLFTMLMILSQYEIVLIRVKQAIVCAGLIGVSNNIYEFFNPGIFGGLNETRRPAGLYVNPNLTGCSLLIILIFGITALPPKLRIPYVLFMGIGIFLTFSRGSLLCFFIVVITLYIYGVIPRRQSFYWGIGLGLFLILVSIMGLSLIDFKQLESMGLLNDNNISRLGLSKSSNGDKSEEKDDRQILAELGWRYFNKHPFFGNGLGTSHQWKEDHRSTHNMYLYFMVDHGFLGFFIYPGFVYATIIKMRGETKSIGVPFTIFILFWGLFSHTVLTQRDILMMFALMATINFRHQLKHRFLNQSKRDNYNAIVKLQKPI